MMLGLQEGGQQFNSVVDVHSKNVPGIDRNEAVKDIAEILKDLPINRADIIAKAAPKLQEMMLASYEKEYSGGVLRWLFGSDFKDSKDYQNFKRMIEGYLKPEASNMIRTRLKRKGVDKEVYITLVSLDSTSDRARKFRTEDGRYFVTLSGDTENYSGWVTDEGKPLEDIYLDQAIADETADPEREKERLAKLKKQLAGGALRISAKYNGLGYAFPQASLTNVPAGDLQFQEFLRSPEALSMTVDEAGLSAHVTATQRFDKEVTDYDSTFEVLFVARRGHDGTTIEVWNNGGHPQAVAGDWFARAGADLNRDLGARRLAALPKLL